MEKEGRLEKQADFCVRRETEMEDCWTTVCIYFHSAARKGKRQRREEDRKKRSEEDDAGAHLLLAHNRWEGETMSKKMEPRVEEDWNIYSRSTRQKG